MLLPCKFTKKPKSTSKFYWDLLDFSPQTVLKTTFTSSNVLKMRFFLVSLLTPWSSLERFKVFLALHPSISFEIPTLIFLKLPKILQEKLNSQPHANQRKYRRIYIHGNRFTFRTSSSAHQLLQITLTTQQQPFRDSGGITR